jgi:predicted kinase
MTTCLILRGVPGCGKSTIAAETGYEIVSRDSIRLKHLGGEEIFSDEGLVTAVQNTLIDYHLRVGTDVVVDNTNVEWKYVRNIAGIALLAGARVKIQVVDVPLEEALRRNARRGMLGGREVPEEVIRHYHDRLQISKDWTL